MFDPVTAIFLSSLGVAAVALTLAAIVSLLRAKAHIRDLAKRQAQRQQKGLPVDLETFS